MFELVPGASRMNDPVAINNKTPIERIAVSRAGHADNQFIAFVDSNRELFCTNSLINAASVEMHKIGKNDINRHYQIHLVEKKIYD